MARHLKLPNADQQRPQFTKFSNARWKEIAACEPPFGAQAIRDVRWHFYAHRHPEKEDYSRMAGALELWELELARLYRLNVQFAASCTAYNSVKDEIDRQMTLVYLFFAKIEFAKAHLKADIEIFYITLKQLLDRIALTFMFYFEIAKDERRGSDHSALTEKFKRFFSRISEKDKTPKPIYGLMRDLDKRIVSFRNDYIEHPDGPDLSLGPVIPQMDGTLTFGVTGTFSEDQRFTDHPDELISLVERYIILMLGLFCRYHSSSRLPFLLDPALPDLRKLVESTGDDPPF